jgi:hypothetical protein
MFRFTLWALGLLLVSNAFAQDLALKGFESRFKVDRNAEGKVTAIKLKKAITRFTIIPFIEQLKNDLKREQAFLNGLSDSQLESEVDSMLFEMGYGPNLVGTEGEEEAARLRQSLLSVRNINVDTTFRELNKVDFWKEFESKLNEAFLFIDPTILANLDDARFFYKRQVTYKVVVWALEQAKKRFAHIPVLNIASFVIVRVHEMMLEQRHFHHNMLLHYFETIPESKLGMTKEEVDRSVSSIYEYRIQAENLMESNKAARDWLNYGMNAFYIQVRTGNSRIRSWESGLSNMSFQSIRKLNFGFAQVNERGAERIYHLHINAHQFSGKPALAYDFADPNRVKRNRALLNIGNLALGFIEMPGWLKGQVEAFINSMYVNQVRTEGALVGHFESMGNEAMIRKIYDQRANFYILQ